MNIVKVRSLNKQYISNHPKNNNSANDDNYFLLSNNLKLAIYTCYIFHPLRWLDEVVSLSFTGKNWDSERFNDVAKEMKNMLTVLLFPKAKGKETIKYQRPCLDLLCNYPV